MDRFGLKGWVEELREAWEAGDPGRAGSLFTVQAEYHHHPFRPPLQGRQEIEEYWMTATAGDQRISVTMGEPLLDGDRAAVEWWARTVTGDHVTTDCGALVLTFEGNLCASLREYWILAEGAIDPVAGWGR